MSDQERQNIALLVGRLDGKLDGLVEKVDNIDERQFRIDSKLNEGYKHYAERLDEEKAARQTIERELISTREDFTDAFKKHCDDDAKAFAGVHAKLDVIVAEKSEARKTWSERIWAVSKFVGLIVGAWAAARLGVNVPTL
jgi:DNA-binding ferritin-like protein